MTFNTGNPVGSADPRDLYDNAQNLDRFSNGEDLEYPDRLGRPRKSLAGIRAEVTEALSNLGYQVIGDYAPGLVVQNYGQVFRKDGEFYRAKAELTLPYPLNGDWAVDAPKFVSVGDAVLRQELADPALGGDLVKVATSTGEQTLVDALDNRVIYVDSIADLRALEPAVDGQQCELLGHTVAGLGGGMFYADYSSTAADDDGVTVVTAGGMRWVRRLEGYVTPLMFGAAGDGVRDDTAEAQAALDFGGIIDLGEGYKYKLTRQYTGVDMRYALNIRTSGVTLRGASTLTRGTSIVSDIDAYPILLIGHADDNNADVIENTSVIGVHFEGSDTRHSLTGNAPHDHRSAIETTNCNRVTVTNCRFSKVDSAALFSIMPGIGGVRTKNYNLTFTNNLVEAVPHNVFGRALIHAVNLAGFDGAVVSGNSFTWCDDAVSGAGTYDNYEQDGSTYTDPLKGAILRSGRGWIVSDNVCKNSSEHAFYLSGTDVTVTGNIIYADTTEVCVSDIKFRSTGCTISGNRVEGAGIVVASLSRDVTVTGNSISVPPWTSLQSQRGITVDSEGLPTYVNNRPYISGYPRMDNIKISGNIVKMPEGKSNTEGIRVYTSISSPNYPYEIGALSIQGNSVAGGKQGISVINSLFESILIEGNTFVGEPFVESGFSSATTVPSENCVQIRLATGLRISFVNNIVKGYVNLCGSTSSYSSVAYMGVVSGNTLDFIQNLKNSYMQFPDAACIFTGNRGAYWLDRNFSGSMIGNALSNTTFNEYRRQQFAYTGSGLRFHTDDIGGFITL